jgi:hypothetical protein
MAAAAAAGHASPVQFCPSFHTDILLLLLLLLLLVPSMLPDLRTYSVSTLTAPGSLATIRLCMIVAAAAAGVAAAVPTFCKASPCNPFHMVG